MIEIPLDLKFVTAETVYKFCKHFLCHIVVAHTLLTHAGGNSLDKLCVVQQQPPGYCLGTGGVGLVILIQKSAVGGNFLGFFQRKKVSINLQYQLRHILLFLKRA